MNSCSHNMDRAIDHYPADFVAAEQPKFEAWIKERGYSGWWIRSGESCDTPRDYLCVDTQFAWEVWIALKHTKE